MKKIFLCVISLIIFCTFISCENKIDYDTQKNTLVSAMTQINTDTRGNILTTEPGTILMSTTKPDVDLMSTTKRMEKITNQGEENQMTNLCLSVNGNTIKKNDCVMIHKDERFAEIPLIAVLKELGATVVWKNQFVAQITYNDINYTLSTNENSLIEDGSKKGNLIAPPPGTPHKPVFKVIDNDFVVDTHSLGRFFKLIGVEILIDYENALVDIVSLAE